VESLTANKAHGLEGGTGGPSEQGSPTRSEFLQRLQLHLPISADTCPGWRLRARKIRGISMVRDVAVG